MSIKFAPTGLLDIASDASTLPSQVNGKVEVSGAMTRCKNLKLIDNGIAKTRDGSRIVGMATVDQTTPYLLVEQSGDRYLFAGTKIYKNESSIGSGFTSAKWRAALYNAYNVTTQSIFALNGTDRKRITDTTIREWGIDAPTVAPTLAGIDYAIAHSWEADNITGEALQFTTEKTSSYDYVYGWEEFYQDDIEDHPEVTTASGYGTFWFELHGVETRMVTYTYCRKDGDILECESSPYLPTELDDEGNIVWTSLEFYPDSGIKVTWTASSDPQVTHVRLYRTLPDGTTFYYDSEVAIGSTSTILTKIDAELGSNVETDNDRPPLGSVVVGPVFNGYLFILKDNLLYYCKANRPESWPELNYVEVGPPQFPLTGAIFHGGILYVFNKNEMYIVQGTGTASFFPYPGNALTGAVCHEGLAAVRGMGIFRVAIDGIWLFDGTTDTKFSQNQLDPIFRGETVNGIPAVNTSSISNSWLMTYKNFLYFGYPSGTATKPNAIIVLNLHNKRLTYYDYSQTFPVIMADKTNNRILAADTSGRIWQLDIGSDDNGSAISWEVQSKAFSDAVYKYFPRYAKYDVDVGTGATATGEILLNEDVKQSHTLTGSRNTRKRLIGGCTGDRLMVRVSGSGPVTIRQVEVE